MALARYQFTVTDDEGNVIPSASVSVRREALGNPIVSLYSDREGVTTLGNPFTAELDGYAAFHVSGGAYRITASKDGFSRTWRYVGIGTAQEFDATQNLAIVQYVDAGYALKFEDDTSAPPTTGCIRFNNASLASATEAFVSAESFAGSTISARLLELYSALRNARDGIIVSDAETNKQASFIVTGVTDNTTYVTLSLSGHSGETSFDDDTVVNFQRDRSGLDGVHAGLPFTFDSSTSMADPGAGDFRLNHASFASVTAIALDDTSSASGNPDVSAEIISWDDSDSTIKGTVMVQKIGAPQVFAMYRVTGLTDNSGWTEVAVTYVAGSGALTSTDPCVIKFSRTGDKGTNGVTAGLLFNFDSSTSMADPGTGDFRLNNATLASVTAAAVSDLSAFTGNPDVSAVVLAWDDSTNTASRGFLTIKKTSAPQNFAVYKITGASADNSGWTQLALTYVGHAGSFSNADPCDLEFAPAGDKFAFGIRTISDITSGDTVIATDVGKLVSITTGTGTLAFTAAATLGANFKTTVVNAGTGNVTLDPNSSETIDGLANWVLYPGGAVDIYCDGSGFRSVLVTPMTVTFNASGTFTKPGPASIIEVECWGAGASGGRGTTSVAGGGGGGGGYNTQNFPAASVGETETVTIGTGGATQTGASTTGNPGGTTTFGSLVSAFGGGGGGGGVNGLGGGGGGQQTGGSSGTISGNPGQPRITGDGALMGAGQSIGAAGIAGYFHGGGGGGGDAATGGAGGASVYGGGGGGGGGDTTAGGAGGASSFGGAGGAGATASNVGTDGTQPGGGGGGTETANSGAGANGRVRVKVY
jgi:hypothetical protein